jgi:hypothetical protein
MIPKDRADPHAFADLLSEGFLWHRVRCAVLCICAAIRSWPKHKPSDPG